MLDFNRYYQYESEVKESAKESPEYRSGSEAGIEAREG